MHAGDGQFKKAETTKFGPYLLTKKWIPSKKVNFKNVNRGPLPANPKDKPKDQPKDKTNSDPKPTAKKPDGSRSPADAVVVAFFPFNSDEETDAVALSRPHVDAHIMRLASLQQPQQPQQPQLQQMQPYPPHFQYPPRMMPGQQPMLMGSDMIHQQLQSLVQMHVDWQMQRIRQDMASYGTGAPPLHGAFQQFQGYYPTPPMDFQGAGPGMQYQPPYGHFGASHLQPPSAPQNHQTVPPKSGNQEESAAALCLLAMERGEDKYRKKEAVRVEVASPGIRPGRKRRGRPPKHPMSRADAWERKSAGVATEDHDPLHPSKRTKTKSCKYVGVRMRKWGTYASEIRNPQSGSREWLGTFATPEEAAVVYDVRLRMIRGDGATRANFPPLSPSPVMLNRVINPYGASRPEREEIQIPSDWMDQVLSHKAKLEELRNKE